MLALWFPTWSIFINVLLLSQKVLWCSRCWAPSFIYIHEIRLLSLEVKSLSRVLLIMTPWTATYQAPPSMGFSRQEYWSGVPLPSPGDLPDPGIEPRSPTLQTDTLPSEPQRKLWALDPSITKGTMLYARITMVDLSMNPSSYISCDFICSETI